jgi:hypothetical protein
MSMWLEGCKALLKGALYGLLLVMLILLLMRCAYA